jgi:hypothetical protein
MVTYIGYALTSVNPKNVLGICCIDLENFEAPLLVRLADVSDSDELRVPPCHVIHPRLNLNVSGYGLHSVFAVAFNVLS